MIYLFNISTPANTAESAKVKTPMPVTSGIVHQIEIYFPPGSAGLLHLHIDSAGHQVWPYNAGSNFVAQDANLSFREFIPILKAPYVFTAYTWNEDDTNDHLLIIKLGILPPRVVAPWLMSFEEQLSSALGSN